MTAVTETSRGRYTGPPFDEAHVYDAMRVGVVTCRPETSLHDVARMMVTYDIHAVVVQEIGSRSSAWGIVSTLDLAAAAATGTSELNAASAATTDVVTIPSNESLRQAAKLMAEHGITHLVAVEPATGWPVGVISASALAAAMTARNRG
jgi:CBS domain-containing protein